MVSQRDGLRSRRYALRAAATALMGSSPALGMAGPRRVAVGIGAAITVVSLTIAAAVDSSPIARRRRDRAADRTRSRSGRHQLRVPAQFLALVPVRPRSPGNVRTP